LLQQDAQHTHPRFVMLETIRSFAWERLEADGQALEMRRRHAEYFAGFAETAMPHLTARDRTAWLDRVQDDHDNMRAAITFAIETGDAHLGMRLIYALWRFWQSRAHLQEGAERTATVLAIPTDELRTELRARALEAGGGIAYWRGDLDAGRRYYDEALDIARQIGDQHLIADGIYNAAMVRNVLEVNPREIVDQSMDMLNEAIRLYRETGDQLGAARALWGLGTAQYFSEDWPVAVDTFRAAEEALSAGDDEFMQGWVLHMLGTTEIRLGQLDSALGHIRGALVNMRAAGETTGLVLVLDDFADYAAATGDIPRSLRLIGAGRALEDATGTGLAVATETVMRRERYREALRAEDADRLVAEGRALSLDEAVEYALQAVPQAPPA
jgi:tetratricopeptide (TPR) repeat protein